MDFNASRVAAIASRLRSGTCNAAADSPKTNGNISSQAKTQLLEQFGADCLRQTVCWQQLVKCRRVDATRPSDLQRRTILYRLSGRLNEWRAGRFAEAANKDDTLVADRLKPAYFVKGYRFCLT